MDHPVYFEKDREVEKKIVSSWLKEVFDMHHYGFEISANSIKFINLLFNI